MVDDVSVFAEGPYLLGEGIHWDGRVQRLYWIDIENRQMFMKSWGEKIRSFALPGMPGTLVLTEDPEVVLLACDVGVLRLSLDTGKTEMLSPFPEDSRTSLFNDGKCDPSGRLWVGTMDRRAARGKGSLYRMNPDSFTLEPVLQGLSVPNGICWSHDAKRLYHIDSPERVIKVFHFDADSGQIDSGKAAVRIPEGWGSPDGMAIDEADNLWVAHWEGSCVACYDPSNGKVIHRHRMPAPKITSCCFGGEELNTLFITSALGSSDGGYTDSKAFPLSGALFFMKTQVRGRATHLFSSSGPDRKNQGRAS